MAKKYFRLPAKVIDTLPLQYQKLEQMPKSKFPKWTIKNPVPSKFLNTQKMKIFPMYKPISKII